MFLLLKTPNKKKMDNQLRQCQLLQLNIAKEVKRICEKHNIKYFLNAGTLLGAIRHGGFIPWDDDLDIGMLRAEYDKFLEIAPVELNKKYFLQTWDSDPNYAMPFAKIRLNGTKYIEYNSRNVDIHKGIYIDVFPYDRIPDNNLRRIIQKYKSKFYWHLLLNKSKYEYVSEKQYVKRLMCGLLKKIATIYSYKNLHDRFYKIMVKYNQTSTKKVVTFGGASSFEKESLEYEWIKEVIEKSFENTTFFIPKSWDEYLVHFYGDYMTPPPIDKRYEGHNIIECNFGNEV